MIDREYEGPPLEAELAVVVGVLEDSPAEPRRVRLLDAAGEKMARLSGILSVEPGEGFERLVRDGPLSAAVRIPLDPDTRCTTSPDGTVTGTLPNGATWTTTPLWARGLRS